MRTLLIVLLGAVLLWNRAVVSDLTERNEHLSELEFNETELRLALRKELDKCLSKPPCPICLPKIVEGPEREVYVSPDCD